MAAGPVPSIYLCEQDLVLYAGDSSTKLRSSFHGHEHCPLHLPTLLLHLFNKSQQGLAATSAGLLLYALLKVYAVLLCKR